VPLAVTKFSWLRCDEVINQRRTYASARRAESCCLFPSSILVPCLRHEEAHRLGAHWRIAELSHVRSCRTPTVSCGPLLRAHCRSICVEIHFGLHPLRASLAVTLKDISRASRSGRARRPIRKPGVRDLARVVLAKSGGRSFGERSMAERHVMPGPGTLFMTYVTTSSWKPRRKTYADRHVAAVDAGMDRGGEGRALLHRGAFEFEY